MAGFHCQASHGDSGMPFRRDTRTLPRDGRMTRKLVQVDDVNGGKNVLRRRRILFALACSSNVPSGSPKLRIFIVLEIKNCNREIKSRLLVCFINGLAIHDRPGRQAAWTSTLFTNAETRVGSLDSRLVL